MGNVLQDYFDRLTAVNRQRGMTGNMQYGRGLDASLAEGYFDAAQKNKNASQDLALRQQALNDQRVYQQGALANQASSTDMYRQALGNQNTWQTVTALGQLGAAAGGFYQKQQALNQTNQNKSTGLNLSYSDYQYNQQQQTTQQDMFKSGAAEAAANPWPEGGFDVDYMGNPLQPGSYNYEWSKSFNWVDDLGMDFT